MNKEETLPNIQKANRLDTMTKMGEKSINNLTFCKDLSKDFGDVLQNPAYCIREPPSGPCSKAT